MVTRTIRKYRLDPYKIENKLHEIRAKNNPLIEGR